MYVQSNIYIIIIIIIIIVDVVVALNFWGQAKHFPAAWTICQGMQLIFEINE